MENDDSLETSKRPGPGNGDVQERNETTQQRSNMSSKKEDKGFGTEHESPARRHRALALVDETTREERSSRHISREKRSKEAPNMGLIPSIVKANGRT